MIVLHACLTVGCTRPVYTDDDLCDECRKEAARKDAEQRASSAIHAAKGWRGKHSNGDEYRLRARTGGGDE